jgi:hypothetical protein
LGSFLTRQEPRHGQPSVIADVRKNNMNPHSWHFSICVAVFLGLSAATACFGVPDIKIEDHQEAFAPIRLNLHNKDLKESVVIPAGDLLLNTTSPEEVEQNINKIPIPVPTEKKIIYSTMPIIAPDNSKNYAVQYWNPPADKNYTLRVTEVEVINPQESDQKQK